MKNKYLFISLILLISCGRFNHKSDAYGNFESTEVTISAETNGKILDMKLEEGQVCKTGESIGAIDSVDLILKKQQLMAQRNVILSRQTNINSQGEVQKQQKENLLIEKKRIENLLKDGAINSKQLDDINANIRMAEKQILSIQSQGASIPSELESLNKQISQVNENIRKCNIICPVNGTILTKYSNTGEFVMPGKALFKIADLSSIYLRVYISGLQLPKLKIGQTVEVLVDKDGKENKKYSGTITWISQNAEFTPKIIQTKEERVNLVYAVKVLVKNDGYLKIGMPGEVNFINVK
jgi:HlyD family secretion protein